MDLIATMSTTWVVGGVAPKAMSFHDETGTAKAFDDVSSKIYDLEAHLMKLNCLPTMTAIQAYQTDDQEIGYTQVGSQQTKIC